MTNEKEINDLKEILESIKIDVAYNIKHGLDNTFNFESYVYYINKLENLLSEC